MCTPGGARVGLDFGREYVFYLDLESGSRHGGGSGLGSSAQHKQLDAALANIKEFAIELTELGRYSENMPGAPVSSHRDLYR